MTRAHIYEWVSNNPLKVSMNEWHRHNELEKIEGYILKHSGPDCYYCPSYSECENCKIRDAILDFFDKKRKDGWNITEDEINRSIDWENTYETIYKIDYSDR